MLPLGKCSPAKLELNLHLETNNNKKKGLFRHVWCVKNAKFCGKKDGHLLKTVIKSSLRNIHSNIADIVCSNALHYWHLEQRQQFDIVQELARDKILFIKNRCSDC